MNEMFICDRCEELISEGMQYYQMMDSEILCEDCVHNMTSSELIKYFGGVLQTARESA